MSTLVKTVMSSVYALLDNCSTEELDYVTAMEQYAVTSFEMQNEKILAYRNPEIIKATIEFSDVTGIANDTLTNFVEDVVYLEFNERPVEEVPANMLDVFADMGQQAVAFYKDLSTGSTVAKIGLALKILGDLVIWYEPRPTIEREESGNTELEDSLVYMLATRLAYNCSKYLHFKDPVKEANKPVLMMGLREQSNYAKELYKSKINRIGAGNRPYARLPYRAG